MCEAEELLVAGEARECTLVRPCRERLPNFDGDESDSGSRQEASSQRAMRRKFVGGMWQAVGQSLWRGWSFVAGRHQDPQKER